MVTLIVAMDQNQLIGNDNELPWRIPSELKHFKETTTGNAVIMGRKTWDSIPSQYKPLGGRINIVVSRSRHADECCCGAHFVDSVEQGIKLAKQLKPQAEIFIAGGRSIYEYVLDNHLVDRMLISWIEEEFEGNIYFPIFPDEWDDGRLISSFEKFSVWEYLKDVPKT